MDFADSQRFEPMTTGSLLDRSFRLYGENFALMLGITTAAYVPLYGTMLFVQAAATAAPGERNLTVLVAQFVFVILWISLALPLATGAATYAISERYLGNEITVGQALSRAWRRLWALSVAQISAGLRVFFGFLLLIVPGILWLLSYSLVVPVVLVEGQNAASSLRRSRQLVKGSRMKVFAVLVVVTLLQWLVSFGVGNLAGLFLDRESTAGDLIDSLVGDLVQIVLTPYGIIASILVYYDFRIRKEGFDLEMLSRSIAPTRQETSVLPSPSL
jgi:uncharacterized membrane protein